MATTARKIQGSGGLGGSAEHWVALLGGSSRDLGYAVAVDSADNVVIVGETQSDGAGGADVLVAKYDTLGVLLWSKTLGGAAEDTGYAVAVDSLDNIVVVGTTASSGAGYDDVLIAKYDPSGSLTWQLTLGIFPFERGYAVAVDSSDYILVLGESSVATAGFADFLIAKYSPDGALIWKNLLGGSSSDYGRGIAVDSLNNILVTGFTQSAGAGGFDLLLSKISPSGVVLWNNVLGGSGTDEGLAVAVDSSDNIVVAGRTNSDGAGNYDALVAKYDASGSLLWAKTYGVGGISPEYGYGVAVDSLDNIIVVGRSRMGSGLFDFFIAKYNSSGTLLWEQSLGGSSMEEATAVAVDSLDNIVVSGYASSDGAGNYDILTAKLHPDGLGNGTYGSLTYKNINGSSADAVLTDGTATLAFGPEPLLSSSPATLTSQDAVLTEELFIMTI